MANGVSAWLLAPPSPSYSVHLPWSALQPPRGWLWSVDRHRDIFRTQHWLAVRNFAVLHRSTECSCHARRIIVRLSWINFFPAIFVATYSEGCFLSGSLSVIESALCVAILVYSSTVVTWLVRAGMGIHRYAVHALILIK